MQNHKDADPNFANELVFEMINYQMSPKLLVSYKRKPFFAKNDSTFRVTFDYDLEFAHANGANYNEEFTPLREIPNSKLKVKYMIERFHLSFVLNYLKKVRRTLGL